MRRLTLLLVLVLLAIPGVAQTPTATVRGTIDDGKGAVIPGAKITLTSETTGISKTAQTDQAGRYEIPFIDPGNYDVTAEAKGFQAAKQTGITVELFQVRPVDFSLKVGGVTEQIQVNAETTPPLDTTTSSTGQVVSTKLVTDVPLNGRNAFDLASIAPGVNTTGGASTPHIAGSRNANNEQQIDGMTNIMVAANIGINNSAILPILDSVQEVSVQTSVLPAEYGRFSGGVISLVTKSGGNQYHGTAYEFARNGIFNAKDYFLGAQPKPDSHAYTTGGVLGGPIRIPHLYDGRKRSFFFFAYEKSSTATSTTVKSSVPLPAMKNGDFSMLSVPIYDPLTIKSNVRTPFRGNIIPASRFSTVGKNILSYFPDPNIGTPGQLFQNRSDSGVAPAHYYHWDLRLDHDFTSRWHTFLRLSHTVQDNAGFRWYGENNPASPGARAGNSTAWSMSFNNIFTFSPTVFAEVRYGFSKTTNVARSYFGPFDLGSLGLPAYVAQQAAKYVPAFPYVSFGEGYSAIGHPGYSIWNQPARGDDVIASLVKIAGAHSLKFGGEYRRLWLDYSQWGYPSGQYAASQYWTQRTPASIDQTPANPNGNGNSIASLLLGLPTSGLTTADTRTIMSSPYVAFYGQDNWRVSRSLTLNLGLRWDFEIPRTEEKNRLSYWDRDLASPLGIVSDPSGNCFACNNLKGQMIFVGAPNSKYGRHQLPTQWKNFSPRIGVAYSPNDHLALRGGFGIAFPPSFTQPAGSTGGAGVEGFRTNTPYNSTFDNSGNIATSIDNPYPSGYNLPMGAAGGPTTDVGSDIFESFFSSFRATYQEQWNLNLQTALPGKTTLEVGYLGSHGLFLIDGDGGNSFDQVNPSYLSLGDKLKGSVPNPFYGLITLPGSVLARPTIPLNYLLRPYPQYLKVVSTWKPTSASIYHAISLRVDKRFTNGMTFILSFTGSKLMDNSAAPSLNVGPTSNTRADQFHPQWEWAVSPQDVSRTLVTGYTYELPLGRGRKYLHDLPAFVNGFVGGWQTSGFVTYYTGNPVIVGAAKDQTYLISGIAKRPTWNGKSAKLSHPTLAKWFDTSVFSQPGNYVIGMAPRTIANVRNPGAVVPNLSFLKNNRWGSRENYNLQFRFEMFNAINHPRFGAPDASVQDAGTTAQPGNYGKVTTSIANSARQIQVAVKFLF